MPYDAFVMVDARGKPVSCGQIAMEDAIAGLYGIYTAPDARRRGHAAEVCRALLGLARERGARVAYLQVGADNTAARGVYRRLGFIDAYPYHYRTPHAPPVAPESP